MKKVKVSFWRGSPILEVKGKDTLMYPDLESLLSRLSVDNQSFTIKETLFPFMDNCIGIKRKKIGGVSSSFEIVHSTFSCIKVGEEITLCHIRFGRALGLLSRSLLTTHYFTITYYTEEN